MKDFDNLLGWLAADRDQAARKYEDIRRRLIRIFMHRGCIIAEDLADETIERVTKKIDEIRKTYSPEDDPAPYFFRVSHYIHQEYLKRKFEPAPPPPEEKEDLEPELNCLDGCLENLTAEDRELILAYYPGQRRNLDGRREMAKRLGLSLNALRIRAFRIRSELEDCMRERLKHAPAMK